MKQNTLAVCLSRSFTQTRNFHRIAVWNMQKRWAVSPSVPRIGNLQWCCNYEDRSFHETQFGSAYFHDPHKSADDFKRCWDGKVQENVLPKVQCVEIRIAMEVTTYSGCVWLDPPPALTCPCVAKVVEICVMFAARAKTCPMSVRMRQLSPRVCLESTTLLLHVDGTPGAWFKWKFADQSPLCKTPQVFH